MKASYKEEYRSQESGVRGKTAFVPTSEFRSPRLLLVFWLLLSLLSVFFAPFVRAQESPERREGLADLTTSGQQPLTLSVEDAVLLALNRNRDLKVQILNPQIAQTRAQEHMSDFDLEPFLKLQIGQTRDESSQNQDDLRRDYSRIPEEEYNKYFGDVLKITTTNSSQTPTAALGFSKLFSTGTKLEIGLQSQYSDQEREQTTQKAFITDKLSISCSTYSNSGSITLTQPLLRGMGRKINLSLANQAEIDRQISAYELQQYAIELVAKVQKNYWNLVLAEETLKIREKSLDLAERQMNETQERINLGKQAESELVSAQAEVASEKAKLIDAKNTLSKRTLDFLYLLNPDVETLWDQKVNLTTPPAPIEREIGGIHEHVTAAMRFRPDINQAHLNYKKGDLEVVRTQNGLLPRLDFFITLKQMASGPEFPASFSEFDDSDYVAGFNLSRPLGNTRAKAQARRASLTRLQYQESIANLKQSIQVEIRKAIVEINSCTEQITASRANRIMQEEKLKVEQETFRVGRSTNFKVFQVQRDLTEAQVNEVTAIIGQIKAHIDLQVSEGTLLQQWSIETLSPLLR
ncbi:MAG: TolC family protein [bacterium]